MLNTNTYKTFREVLDRIQKNDLDDADAIFLTGDLSQDESPESYAKFIEHLADFNKPIYWIPGNHDCIETLNSAFSNHPTFFKANYLETLHWNFIFLNTKREGFEDGFISDDNFEYLESQLASAKNKSIGIIMHHHPSETGTPMIDGCMLINKKQFFEKIANHNVKMIMCGHVHGDYSISLQNNITLEASPSTCIQWLKGAIEPAFEEKIGYKVYHFGKNNYVAQCRIWDS